MKKYLIALLLPLMAAPLSAQEFLKGKILYFDEGKGIAERGGSDFNFSLTGGLSTSSSISLLDVERALEKAAEDDADHGGDNLDNETDQQRICRRLRVGEVCIYAWIAHL